MSLANAPTMAPDTPPARQRRRRRRTVGGLLHLVTLVMLALAVCGPWLAPHRPDAIIGPAYAGSMPGAWLGTDHLGRDVFSRVLAGGRSLLIVPVIATALTCFIGACAGMVLARAGGWVSALADWVIGLLLALPGVVVLLFVIQAWGYSSLTLGVIVLVTGTPFVTRLARAAASRVASSGYVEHALGLGEPAWSLLLRGILPNIVGPLLADAGTRVVLSMEIVAAAAFLGLGPDGPNWAAMMSENGDGMSLAPWSVAAPALAFTLLTVSLNLSVDRLTRGLLR